jgi:predicted O-methyltransferase YrrM
MIFFRISKYLKYILLSRHRKGHGIHSPFVFDLVSRIFRNKIDPSIVNMIETTRKRLLSDTRNIEINDLGTGSGRKKSITLKVSEIARKSSLPAKYGVLLSNMAAEFGGCHIIELGTSTGISTMYMAASCSGAFVSTVEGCLSLAGIACENFNSAGIHNVNVYSGSFDDILPALIEKEIKPGLVFIDGNHRKEATLKYFELIVGQTDEKTVVVFDDINYSPEMASAWDKIRMHEKVSVSVDINRMGIVFIRSGIAHADYRIRY